MSLEYAPAILLRGNIELATARLPAAAASFREVLRIEDCARPQPLYSRALAQLIEMELAQGDVEGAAADADALLALGERNPQARYLKARVEVEQQELTARSGGSKAWWPNSRIIFPHIGFSAASMQTNNSLDRPRCIYARPCGGAPEDRRRGSS